MHQFRIERRWLEFAASVIWSAGFALLCLLVIPENLGEGTARVSTRASTLAPTQPQAPARSAATPVAPAERAAPPPVGEPPRQLAATENASTDAAVVEAPEPSATAEEVPPPAPGPSVPSEHRGHARSRHVLVTR
jgi:hypothetical protein